MSDPSKDERVTWMDLDWDDGAVEAGIQIMRPDCSRPVRARADPKTYALIGQKLGTLFEVPSDTSSAIEALLRQLDSKFC